MSKTLWKTIKIQVPKEMVQITKSGRVSVKKTLTKMMNISKSNKEPSIQLQPADVNKPEIINNGKEWDVDELKKTMKKSNELRKKNLKQKEDTTINKIVKAIKNRNIKKVKNELSKPKKEILTLIGKVDDDYYVEYVGGEVDKITKNEYKKLTKNKLI